MELKQHVVMLTVSVLVLSLMASAVASPDDTPADDAIPAEASEGLQTAQDADEASEGAGAAPDDAGDADDAPNGTDDADAGNETGEEDDGSPDEASTYGLCTAWAASETGRDHGNAGNAPPFQALQDDAAEENETVEEHCEDATPGNASDAPSDPADDDAESLDDGDDVNEATDAEEGQENADDEADMDDGPGASEDNVTSNDTADDAADGAGADNSSGQADGDDVGNDLRPSF